MGLFDKTRSHTADNQAASSTDKGIVGGLIQCNATNDVLVQKYPYANIKKGAVIKVHQNQRAMLFSNGQRLDTIGPGREVVVDSNNIPFLGRLLNVASGGETTYPFEVWFINMTCERNARIGFNGKDDGIRVVEMNPHTGREVIFPINGFGSYRFKVSNPEIFIDKLVGTEHESTSSDVHRFLEDQIKVILADVINQVILEDQLSPIEVLRSRRDINERYREETNKDISNKYGVEITNFSVRLNSPAYDEYNEAALSGAKKENELGSQGKYYDTERQYDILKKAADNSGVGNTMGIGMGLGMGNSIGTMFGQMANNMNPMAPPPPPVPTSKMFHFVINGQSVGPYALDTISDYITRGVIQLSTLAWCNGMNSWVQASLIPELSPLFAPVPPVPPVPPVSPVSNQ